MVETIAPVVYGRRHDYLVAVALYAASATVVAAAFGTLLGLAGMLVGAPWTTWGSVVVISLGVVYAGRELFDWPLPVFDRKRQVPDWWRTFFSRRVAATLYGAGLGIGFLTYLRHGTYVVVAVLALTSGDPVAGAMLSAPFGLARGLSVLVSGRTATEDDVALTAARLEPIARSKTPATVNAIACLALAVVAVESLPHAHLH